MSVEFVSLFACKSDLTILLLSRRAFCSATCVCLCVSSSVLLRNVCLSVCLVELFAPQRASVCGCWSDLACRSGLTVEGYASRCPARL